MDDMGNMAGFGKNEERAELTRKSRRIVRDSKRRLNESVTVYRGEDAHRLAEKCGYQPPTPGRKAGRKFVFQDWSCADKETR